MHHLDDLSYDPKEYLPHVYGKFREKNISVPVRKLVDTPTCLNEFPSAKDLPGIDLNFMPSLADFGFKDFKADPRSCYPFVGGEDNGLKRLKEYMKKSVGHYAVTRN